MDKSSEKQSIFDKNSSFLDDVNEFDISAEFVKQGNKKKLDSRQNSDNSLSISNIEQKEYSESNDEKKQKIIQVGKINNEINKRNFFKNRLKQGKNVKKNKNRIVEKYLNNPDNILNNEVLIEHKQEENNQEQTNFSVIEDITKEFIKEYKKKKRTNLLNTKINNKIKTRSKTAPINLSEEWKKRWQFKKNVKNWQNTLRDYNKKNYKSNYL